MFPFYAAWRIKSPESVSSALSNSGDPYPKKGSSGDFSNFCVFHLKHGKKLKYDQAVRGGSGRRCGFSMPTLTLDGFNHISASITRNQG